MAANADNAPAAALPGPLRVVLTDDAPLAADAVRSLLRTAGVDDSTLSDETLNALIDANADATAMLRRDPVFAQQVVGDRASAAQQLGRPQLQALASDEHLSVVAAIYEPAGIDADVADLLGRLLMRVADDQALQAAFRADPIATLLTHSETAPPGVLSAAIRRLIAAGSPAADGPDQNQEEWPP
jgi:hypothetical protein